MSSFEPKLFVTDIVQRKYNTAHERIIRPGERFIVTLLQFRDIQRRALRNRICTI